MLHHLKINETSDVNFGFAFKIKLDKPLPDLSKIRDPAALITWHDIILLKFASDEHFDIRFHLKAVQRRFMYMKAK